MNVCKSLLRVATQKNPNRIPEWEQRLRRSRTPDEGDHRGFPSYLSVYPALFWRPGSPRPRLCMNVCKSLLRVATQKNPNRIPEWEQRLRRSRTRDEGRPSGFSLISFSLPSVVLAAGFTPAATMYERLQIVASSGYSEKSDPYTGMGAAPAAQPHAR